MSSTQSLIDLQWLSMSGKGDQDDNIQKVMIVKKSVAISASVHIKNDQIVHNI